MKFIKKYLIKIFIVTVAVPAATTGVLCILLFYLNGRFDQFWPLSEYVFVLTLVLFHLTLLDSVVTTLLNIISKRNSLIVYLGNVLPLLVFFYMLVMAYVLWGGFGGGG